MLNAIPDGHADQPQRLKELASLLDSREYFVLPELIESIQLRRQAADMTPKGLHEATDLSHLAYLNYRRYYFSFFEKSAGGQFLDEAIELERSAIDISSDNQDRAVRLKSLGELLCFRYRRKSMISNIGAGVRAGKAQADEIAGDPASGGQSHQEFMTQAMIDLDEAIKVYDQAIDMIERENIDRRWWLYDVGVLYGDRYAATGSTESLEHAIRATTQSHEIFDTTEPVIASKLGQLLGIRYLRTKDRSDIERAVDLEKRALAEAPLEDLFTYRHGLSTNFCQLYRGTGAIEDLNKAIEAAKQTVSGARKGFQQIQGSDLLSFLLFNRYQQTRTRKDLDEAIEMARNVANIMFFNIHRVGVRGAPAQFAALLRDWWQEEVGVQSHSSDLTEAIEQPACVVIGGSTQIRSLVDLRDLLQTRYQTIGGIEDLVEAVQAMRHVVSLMPKPSNLLNLGFLLLELYDETEDQTVADESAQISRQLSSAENSPKSFPQREHLAYLTAELSVRFRVSGGMENLNKAIKLGTKSLGMFSDNDRNHAAALSHLAHLQYLKFCTTRVWNDLDKALEHSQQLSTSIEEDDVNRGHRLCSYSYLLFQRYTHTLSPDDLDEAIRVGRQAVDASCHHRHMQERIMDKLATALYQRYLVMKTSKDLEDALELGQRAVERKRKDPLNGCSYFVNQASLLCERHVLEKHQADLEEAIKLMDQAWEAIEPREKPHPNCAWLLCYFYPSTFAHFLVRAQDNVQNRVQECRDRLAGLTNMSRADGARDRSNLVLALSHVILHGEPLGDLDEPVRLGREAISMAQIGHSEDLPWHLSCLAVGLRSRFSITNNAEDLAETITLSARAVDMSPKDHPGRPFYLIVHAIGLYCRYSRTARLPDLYESIRLGLEAWSLSSRGDTLADHHNRFWCAGNLSLWFTGKYLREGAVSNLERAIEFRRHADGAALILNNSEPVDLYDMHLSTRNTGTPDTSDEHIILLAQQDGSDCPSRLFNVAAEQFKLFSEKRDVAELSSAIFLCRFSVAATPRGHLQRPSRLEFLGKCLQIRYDLTKGVDASGRGDDKEQSVMEGLDEAIDSLQEVINVACQEHPAWYPSLHRLGPLYIDRHHRSGDLGDLKMALLVLQKSADVTPRVDPSCPSRLRCLGEARKNSYALFNKIADLDEAQRLFQEAVDISPHQCPSRAGYLADLAAVYHTKYKDMEDIDDLEKSLSLYDDALKAWPDHKDPTELLNSIGRAYLEKYKIKKIKSDFEKSIEIMQKSIDKSSADGQERTLRLVSLASIHIAGSFTTPSTASMDVAARVLQEAVDLVKRMSRRKHSDYIEMLSAIGECYRMKYDATHSRLDLDEAMLFLGKAFEQSPVTTRRELVRFIDIAQGLTSALILVEDWHEAFRVIDKSVCMIPLTIPRFLDISESQACLSKYSGLASDGAALAMSANRPAMDAIQILEDGRAVATTALNELRIDASSIAFLGADENNELAELRERLEPSRTSDISNSNVHSQAPHKREEENLQRAAQRISASRKLDDFILDYQTHHNQTGFPGEVDGGTLAHVSREGHVVIVNVSYRCDAFWFKGAVPQNLPLPKLDRQTIQDKVRERNFTSPEVLEWLWDTIASPVLDALGFAKPPSTSDKWPRIWWIPTGPLSMFPLHAAGRHLERSHNSVMDRAISSYSLSIRALEQTIKLGQLRSRVIKPQSRMRQALVVDMEHTPGSSPLPFAGKEVEAVSEACELMSIRSVQPEQRTRQSVLPLLRDCEIFHFAGHGFTDATDPSRSHLRLLDWMDNPLTVTDMVSTNLRERKPFLAYLSACGTGQIRGAKHLDESVHLISACQLAGFLHVVGTLCEVNDETCVDIARITYDGIRKGDMTDESVCHGLHNAVRELRDRWRDRLIGKEMRGDSSLSIRNQKVDRRSVRKEGHRDVILCNSDKDDQQTVSLLWVPYVHYGC
ncbi:CHAT domain-containing protein [Dactylonectria estremocensis]|uniref:CHAT domain-containing protein n=1 Tax=Dactylonectria estremocensis TaxID=1079267 RepID=A0A9P9EMV0_9HYPO|nr:CHAT domain-containing protein [Dactylonectria estremocensis]